MSPTPTPTATATSTECWTWDSIAATATPTPTPIGNLATSGASQPKQDHVCSYPKMADELEHDVCEFERLGPTDPPKTQTVRIEANGDSTAIVAFLRANGAVANTRTLGLFYVRTFRYSDFGDEVLAQYIPVHLLGPLSQLSAVEYIRGPTRGIPAGLSMAPNPPLIDDVSAQPISQSGTPTTTDAPRFQRMGASQQPQRHRRPSRREPRMEQRTPRRHPLHRRRLLHLRLRNLGTRGQLNLL